MKTKTLKIHLDPQKLRPLAKSKNAFASLARSIIYQQLSGTAAASIERKFFALFDPRVLTSTSARGALIGNCIKPEDVAALDDAQFQSCGISAQKRGYLRDLAAKFLNGTVNPKLFAKMSDQEISDHLLMVKGIGQWTADMFLIFALNRPDVLPVGDLGVKKGFQKVFKLAELPDEAMMFALAQPYAGNRTYLTLYLWDQADADKK